MKEVRRRRPEACPCPRSAIVSRKKRPRTRALPLFGALLLLATACAEGREEAATEAPLPGEGSLRIGVRALELEDVAELEVTLVPSKGPPLSPVSLQPPPGGGAFSETVGGIRQGQYTLQARAFDAAQQPLFKEIVVPIVILAGVQNNVELFFVEERQEDAQAPYFVSIGRSGDPIRGSPYRFQVTGGGGAGALTLSGSGPGAFTTEASDPRLGAYVDWAVPDQAQAEIVLTLEDEAGRKAHTRLDLALIEFTCPGSQQVCNGVCAEVESDPLNCGPSCQDCGAEGVCIHGVCRPDPEFANWPIAPDELPVSQFEFVEPSTPYNPMDPVEGVVVDKLTGLMWQRTSSSTAGVLASSETYCATLGLGGYDDWRLPTRMELLSILNVGESFLPDEPVFHGSAATRLWTSSPVAGSDTLVWTVDFGISDTSTGHSNPFGTTTSWWWRCVRFTDDYPKKPLGPRYVVDEETVLDTWTGLRWQRALPALQTFGTARRTCQALKHEGVTARLPTKRELESLVDVYEGGFRADLVGHGTGHHYWTASPVKRAACDWEEARFYVNQDGQTLSFCRADSGAPRTRRVRCVWKETPAEWKVCGTLVDVQRDSNHCGDCNIACGGGERCVAGACQPTPSCEPSESVCDGQCVDPLSDPLHCGECGNDCGDEGVCIDGTCRPDPEFANYPVPPDVMPLSQYQYTDPPAPSYEPNNPDPVDGIVLDTATNLMWQRSSATPHLRSWTNHKIACEDLVIGDYDDWRLPTRMELLTLVNVDNPILNHSKVFIHSNRANHWTATAAGNNPGTNKLRIDLGDTSGGLMGAGSVGNAYNGKCVRFGPRYPKSKVEPRYVEQAGDLVLDSWTGLRWEKTHSSDMSYADAQSYCGGGGRLPTKKELESLVNVYSLNTSSGTIFWTSSEGEQLDRQVGGSWDCVDGEGAFVVNTGGLSLFRCFVREDTSAVQNFGVRCVYD